MAAAGFRWTREKALWYHRRGGVVPRFGEALVDLQVVTGLHDILRQIPKLQKGNQTGFTYRITGRLHSAGGLGFIPFEAKGEFAFPSGSGKSGA